MSNILVRFLRALGVPYTRNYADKLFDEHPYKNNLLGLSQMLNHYGVKTVGLEIDKKDMDKIPVPFVAVFSADYGIVESVTEQGVRIFLQGRPVKLKMAEFMTGWNGIVLSVETSPESREPDYKSHLPAVIMEKGAVALVLAALTGLLLHRIVSYGSLLPPLQFYVVLSLLLIGLGFCILLCIKKVNEQNRFVGKICTMLKNNDCTNVLNSDAASLFGIFSWNEVGISYFISCLCILLFQPVLLPWMAWIGVLGLPFTLWSVFYQWRVIKQWCVLCVAVQLVLWAAAIAYWGFGWLTCPAFSWLALLGIVLIFVLPLLAVKFALKYIAESRADKRRAYDLISLKSQKIVFESLLHAESRYDTSGASAVVFGNPDAGFRITVLTNPYCNPCARFHERVGGLMEHFKDKISLRYVLSSFNSDLEKINYLLVGYYLDHTVEESEKLFAEWYKRKDAESLEVRYGNYLTDPRVVEEIERQKSWAQKYSLTATPTILVNDYMLPKSYEIEELAYVIGEYVYL